MKKFYSISLLYFLLMGASVAQAVSTVLPGNKSCSCDCNGKSEITEVCIDACKQYCGDYNLNDIVAMLPKIAFLLLGLVGSISLLMFVYGGITFLISQGSSDKVQEAKTILINSVIGLVIVFSSYLIVAFVFRALGVSGDWMSSDWTQGW